MIKKDYINVVCSKEDCSNLIERHKSRIYLDNVCYPCKVKRKKEADKMYKEKRKAKGTVPVQSWPWQHLPTNKSQTQ